MKRTLSRALLRLLSFYLRYERWVYVALGILMFLSLVGLLRVFYVQNTFAIPDEGGTYIEGSVGEVIPLNPWFVVANDVNRDIASLVFSGLLRYNPDTRQIEEDLATVQISEDGLNYTLRLREGLTWHDHTEDNPHPVTATDVMFTYQTIQDSQFPNSLLRQNFRGVTIQQLDERTVRFTLERPYSFFLSNLTLGLLPRRAFEGVPVRQLDKMIDFGLNPIGAGPYTLRTIVQTPVSSEVTLERFERPSLPAPRLERIIFRVFPDYPSLLSDLRSLDGIRLVPRTDEGYPVVPRSFEAVNYTLPQYVALFFNLNNDVLKDRNLRLGLQLGTNKLDVVSRIGESVIIDTPLLELDTSDWRYAYDAGAAQGALFESDWYVPEKVRLQRLLEQYEANRIGLLQVPPVVYLETGAVLTITGSLSDIPLGSRVQNVPIQPHPTASGDFILVLPTWSATGSLTPGMNLLRLTNQDGGVLDSAYVWRATGAQEFVRINNEQDLLRNYLATRNDPNGLTTLDMVLDDGLLRRRREEDSVAIRINDQGQKLVLRLLTSDSPDHYQLLAEEIQRQWAALGVGIEIDIPPTRQAFEAKLLSRDYDILLFGQSLLENLDLYPYWHSSESQRLTGQREDLRIDAYNLSQLASFETDALLEVIRTTTNAAERERSLQRLQEAFKREVPAIFLYSPLYTYAHRDTVQGIEIQDLSLHSDKFLTLPEWYAEETRVFQPGRSWMSFPGWLFGSLFSGSDDGGDFAPDAGTGADILDELPQETATGVVQGE